jgi:hypothetical protein
MKRLKLRLFVLSALLIATAGVTFYRIAFATAAPGIGTQVSAAH